MNKMKSYHRVIELIIPFASIAFTHKGIIEENLKIENLQAILLKKGASNERFMEIKEKALKFALTSKSSYYEILEDLVNKEIHVINKIPGSQK